MDPQDLKVRRIDVAALTGPTLGLRGLGSAIDRLRSANVESGMTDVVVAASECIYWVAATDEWLASQDSSYWVRRADAEEGRAVGGLVYARNVSTHHLAPVYGGQWLDVGVSASSDGPEETQPKIQIEGE